MKQKLLFWIIGILLALPMLAFAAVDWGTAQKYDNETFGDGTIGAGTNWASCTCTVSGNTLICDATGEYCHYIKQMPNPETNGNFTIVYDFKGITDAGDYSLRAGVSNLTAGATDNYRISLTTVGETYTMRAEGATNQDINMGFTPDSQWRRLKIIFHDGGTYGGYVVYVNDTYKGTANFVSPALTTFYIQFGYSSNAGTYNIKNFVVYNTSIYPAVIPPPDTTPPNLTKLNSTSGGGLGKFVNLTDPLCLNAGCRLPQENDTTPTLRASFNEAAFASLVDNRTQISVDCTTTGATEDTCTIATALPIGLSNITLNWSDSSGNKNQTTFTMNITDFMPPNSTLEKPTNNAFFIFGLNNTNINFTFSAVDNYDSTFSALVYIDNVLEFTNLTYLNGTNVSYFKTISSIGTHTWYVNITDSFNNKNQSFTNSFTIRNSVLMVNTSFNTTTPVINDIINFTGNITSEINLLFANWTVNMTGGKLYFNYTISGTSAQVSNKTQIIGVRGNVYNFTLYATDISNNVKQNDTLITVANTLPIAPTGDTLIPVSPVITDTMTGGCTGSTDADGDSLTYYYRFYSITDASYRGAGFTTGTTYALVSPTDSHDTLRVDCYTNDGTGNGATRTGTTQRIIGNTVPTAPTISYTAPATAYTGDTLTCSATGSTDADGDSLTYYYTFKDTDDSTVLQAESTTATFPCTTTGCNRGDTIYCHARTYDSYGYGSEGTSATKSISDTIATVSIGVNTTTPIINEVVNVSSNTTDADGLSWCLIKTNQTGVFVNNTFALSGTSGFCSDPITITVGIGSVINFTIEINDTTGTPIYQNSTKITVEQAESVYLFLNGLNENRKYEYLSLVNISANCTHRTAGNCQVELDLYVDKLGFNFTSGNNWINFTFNTSPLRIRNWTHGARTHTIVGSGTLNITSDNKTKIELVSFNISSTGTTTNLNITYYNQTKRFVGDLKSIYLTNDEFIHSGIYKDAVNLTYITKGSNFIYSDFSDINNPINMTFQLSGFDLDLLNAFSYIEHFNGTAGTKGFNDTLSYKIANNSKFVFENFVNNASGIVWVWDTGPCNVKVVQQTPNPALFVDAQSTCQWTYEDNGIGDFRNSSRIEIDQYSYQYGGGASASYTIYATDGVSSVTLQSWSNENSWKNITLTRTGDKKWNGIDLSTLNWNNQIKLRWEGDEYYAWIYNIRWSGAALNRSNINGTFTSGVGNITSNVLNATKTNISKAILTAYDYEPTNTKIDYYLSNTCNNTLPIFESVTSGVQHTFVSVGNKICWRATLNSSVNITSPVIRKVQVDITPSSIENVTVDLGDDGTNDFTFLGKLNSTTSPTFVNLTPTANQLNTIKISSVTAGVIMVDQFKVNSSVNPVSLNKTYFENCYLCSINFTFSGNNLNVFDLKFDFLGSWNFTAIARYGTLKINKTIQVYYSNFNASLPKGVNWYDVFPSSKDAKNVTPYGQKTSTPIWNITNQAYDESIDIYVKTNATVSCLNVTYGNESNRSSTIINSFKLNTTYQKILGNISLINISKVTQINESINITINRTLGTNSTILNYSILQNEESVRNNSEPFYLLYRSVDYSINYTNSNFTLLNVSFNQSGLRISYNRTLTIPNSKGIWNWWDLSNCTQRFYIPYVYFTSICSSCYFENGTQLDRFNTIIE